MTVLAIIGVGLVAVGLAGLGYCIAVGLSVRRNPPGPEAARRRLKHLVAVNLASLGLAALGLGLLTIGLVL